MNQFDMKDYRKKPTFASFLPGIAGKKGTPIWCYYVNRGQGVVSFGVDNKDQAIMEFYPAHVAYQNVATTGFRTFLRVGGQYVEPFSDEQVPHVMHIRMHELEIEEENAGTGLKTSASYFILPEEPIGALVRKVQVTNLTGQEKELEMLDGMPALIPFGVDQEAVKEMTQLSKAWMQVEDLETKIPFFRVRASMADTASVTEVKGGHFALAIDDGGELLQPVVDNWVIFSYDNSLRKPVVFEKEGLEKVLSVRQNTSNLFPGAFFAVKKTLRPGETCTVYELIGHVGEKAELAGFLKSMPDSAWFSEKERRSGQIVAEIGDVVDTATGHEAFDAYCKYTYMDNVLRGGFPIRLAGDKIFYVYSRKHGDLEREYNYFSMSPEFYSQGNGNFRDVNQNRRCDSFLTPFVGRKNIHQFYSLIQPDGYNPLSIERSTYILTGEQARTLAGYAEGAGREILYDAITKAFTPGGLYAVLNRTVEPQKREEAFAGIIAEAAERVGASFGEGYWSDHWTYNLDLVEEYLALWPEEEESLLEEKVYTYFKPQAYVQPRRRRYEVTENGVRQYHAVAGAEAPDEEEKLVTTASGEIYTGTLLEKLVLLSTLKFAALDPSGRGVEMEGGKPGWYDALNGLPGLLGSSMAETYELARTLHYTISALQKYEKEVTLFQELAQLVKTLDAIAKKRPDYQRESLDEETCLPFWNAVNDAREAYRAQIYKGLSGETEIISSPQLAEILAGFLAIVDEGIQKSREEEAGLVPTYYYYEVTDYSRDEQGILPLAVLRKKVPAFLEGPVRYLKLPMDAGQKRALYQKVKESGLYDQKLQMYKVNTSLEEASFELGRAHCFTPGWLENESIWLHMEYKYLLELLKSGLYKEFAVDFHKAGVPFMDPEVYGRSILENSSFLASSRNPDERIHGQGFVARLSGSTIEFLSIWRLLMFGRRPFTVENGELCCELKPCIPAYLLGEEKTVRAKLLNHTRVTYHVGAQADYFPGEYEITGGFLEYADGGKEEITGGVIRGKAAYALRNGEVEKAEFYLLKK